MKPSDHAVHPDLAAPVADLRVLLKKLYPGEDFAFSLHVEGILVASAGHKEDTEPTVWAPGEVAGEVKKRADVKAKMDGLKEAAKKSARATESKEGE